MRIKTIDVQRKAQGIRPSQRMDRTRAGGQATRIILAAVYLQLALIIPLMTPRSSHAYNCSGRDWGTITVGLSNYLAGETATYTISTTVPALDGCNLIANSQITLIFPGTTSVEGISTGTLNGFLIGNYTVKSGNILAFVSPIAVGNGQPVVIVLHHVVNDGTPGAKQLTMSASPVRTGSTGTTTSSAFALVVRTPTPTETPIPTFTPTRTPTRTGTATQTASRTTTATMTRTVTQTISPSPTMTRTATPGLCVGGANANPCSPGGGPESTDCIFEWLTRPIPFPDRRGVPKTRLRCYEGDPRCDADPDLGNAACHFQMKFCVNNQDPRLGKCVPSDAQIFEVKFPNPARLGDSADVENLKTLEEQAGIAGLGLTIVRKHARVFVGMENATPNLCTDSFEIVVPLRRNRSGRLLKRSKKLRVETTTSYGRKDTDNLRLECHPSTCGDGIVQGDHENCDDGNRINGDGCDQGCLAE